MALPFLGLFLSLALLLVLQRQIHRHLQGLLFLLTQSRKTTLILYAILFFPGVLLHEGSHWLVAKVLRVQTKGFSLIPSKSRDGMIRFGYVETAASDPLRASIIGAAPLLAGGTVLAVLTLEYLGLRTLSANLTAGNLPGVLAQVGILLDTPDLLIWLYLAFTIGNTMLPSKSDRAAWVSAAIVMAALVLLGLLSGMLDWVAPWLLAAAALMANNLIAIFIITAALDALILLPVLFTEALTARVIGREIIYDG